MASDSLMDDPTSVDSFVTWMKTMLASKDAPMDGETHETVKKVGKSRDEKHVD